MAIIESISLLTFVVVLLYYFLTKNWNHWSKLGIPYEKPTLLFGNVFEAVFSIRNHGDIYTDIYRKFKGEKVVGFFNFLTPALIVRDPDIVAKLLTADFQYFANNDIHISEDVDPVMGRHVFSLRGERWKKTRQAMTAGFTLTRIKSAYPTIQSVAKDLIKWIEEHPESEVKESLSLYSAEIFATTGAGINGHSFTEVDPVLTGLGGMMFKTSFGKVIKFIIITTFPFIAKLFQVRYIPKEVPDFFYVMLRDVLKNREKSSEVHNDLLQHYIDLNKKRSVQNPDGAGVTDDDVLGGLSTYFLESYETTTLVASILLYHLIKDQKLQGELRSEVDEAFRATNGELPLEKLLELPLLDKILMEASRLYGMKYLFKLCTKDYVLDLENGKTLPVKEGTSVVCPIEGIQSDPDYWEKPFEFYPDHFSEEAKLRRRKNIYYAFGDGPRMCLGMRIAKVMTKTVICHLVHNFELIPNSRTAEKFVQDPSHWLSSAKGGVHCNFVKRSNVGL